MNNLEHYWNDSSAGVPDDKPAAAFVHEFIANLPNSTTVLDLGGGLGADSLALAAAGHEVTLADISTVSLERAQKRAHQLRLPLVTTQLDIGAASFPFADGAFGAVYSRLALHYFPSAQLGDILREVYRILRPGGFVWLSFKAPSDEREMKFLASTAQEIAPGVFEDHGIIKTRFTASQLMACAEAAGFSPASSRARHYDEPVDGTLDRVKSGAHTLGQTVLELVRPT